MLWVVCSRDRVVAWVLWVVWSRGRAVGCVYRVRVGWCSGCKGRE